MSRLIVLGVGLILASCHLSKPSGELTGVVTKYAKIEKNHVKPVSRQFAKRLLIPRMLACAGDSVRLDAEEMAKLTVSPFVIQAHEVTVGQYCVFLNQKIMPLRENARKEIIAQLLDLESSGIQVKVIDQQILPVDDKQATYPMVNVTWNGAMAYCRWLTDTVNGWRAERGLDPLPDYRLPSEAEWLQAAASKGMIQRPLGLQQVGQNRANILGISGLRENAAEWCLDHFIPHRVAAQVLDPSAIGAVKPHREGMLTRGHCPEDVACDRIEVQAAQGHPKVGFRVAMTILGRPNLISR